MAKAKQSPGPRVQNLSRLIAKLSNLAGAVRGNDPHPVVAVGYTAAYALPLHERIEMKWRGLPRDRSVRLGGAPRTVTTGHNASKAKGLFWGPTGEAKFLERPFRELAASGEFFRIIYTAMKRGATLAQGLVLAGLRLQRESQKRVPVLTGNLRNTAFTRLEG
jgi:hypothetical protein